LPKFVIFNAPNACVGQPVLEDCDPLIQFSIVWIFRKTFLLNSLWLPN